MAYGSFYYERNEAVETLGAGTEAIFESRTRFLVFAASVGFAHDRWVSEPGDDGEMRWMFIRDNDRLSVIVKALTYARTDDPDSITNTDEQVETLVKFGAGGSRIIQAEIVDEPGDNLDNLIDFLQENRSKEYPERQDVLTKIEAEVSSLRSVEDQ